MEMNKTKLLNKLKVALYSGDDFAEDPALDEKLLSFWFEEICLNAPITSEEFEKAEAEYHALIDKFELTLNEEQQDLFCKVVDAAFDSRFMEGNAIFLQSIKMGIRLCADFFLS